MSKVFEHILIPYNGTPSSQKAFKKAVELASLTNSKVTIFTCLEERTTFGLFKTKANKQEFEQEQKLVHQKHEELMENASKHNVSSNSKIVKDNMASHAIIEFAEKHNVDLIVLGMKKLTRYEKTHFPSTVEDVSRNFKNAVLIIN